VKSCALLRTGAGSAERRADQSLQTLASKPASLDSMHFVDFIPDITFLRISTREPDRDLAYTLVRDKMHTNVAFLLGEKKRREPEKDNLTVYHGLLGSYPNFMFNVPLESIGEFTDALHAARTPKQFRELVSRYGLSRTHPDIWDSFRWFVEYMRRTRPLEAGIYDMNRYKKVADMMADETGT
jgi:hypothetical protein